MADSPKPRGSPAPAFDERHDVEQLHEKTPAYGVVTVPLLKRKLDEQKEETFAALVKSRFVTLLLMGGFSVATMSGVAYAYGKLIDNAKDAGTEAAKTTIAPVEAQAKGTEARTTVLEAQHVAELAETNGRFERIERDQNRAEKKIDKLLERLDVPNSSPAPTLPKDGGR